MRGRSGLNVPSVVSGRHADLGRPFDSLIGVVVRRHVREPLALSDSRRRHSDNHRRHHHSRSHTPQTRGRVATPTRPPTNRAPYTRHGHLTPLTGPTRDRHDRSTCCYQPSLFRRYFPAVDSVNRQRLQDQQRGPAQRDGPHREQPRPGPGSDSREVPTDCGLHARRAVRGAESLPPTIQESISPISDVQVRRSCS